MPNDETNTQAPINPHNPHHDEHHGCSLSEVHRTINVPQGGSIVRMILAFASAEEGLLSTSTISLHEE
jgi:hypothetical protein